MIKERVYNQTIWIKAVFLFTHKYSTFSVYSLAIINSTVLACMYGVNSTAYIVELSHVKRYHKGCGHKL